MSSPEQFRYLLQIQLVDFFPNWPIDTDQHNFKAASWFVTVGLCICYNLMVPFSVHADHLVPLLSAEIMHASLHNIVTTKIKSSCLYKYIKGKGS